MTAEDNAIRYVFYKHIITVVAFALITAWFTPSAAGSQISPGKKPAASTAHSSSNNITPVHSYKLVNTYPHSQKSFTQGLVIDKGILYEGTGLRGRSRLLKVDIKTGSILKAARLPDYFFGEGVTIYKDKIIQLTWLSGNGFIYDKESLGLLSSFKYDTQGWGITHDSERLIMSDGTAHLYFLDPMTLKKTGQIEVLDNGEPVSLLNELEYINGHIYANVWKTDRIALIDPKNGQVTAWIDLGRLKELAGGDNDKKTLNGIAYDADENRLFVTGKLWPAIYEIKIVK